MKPATFDYHRPETLAETLDLLAEYGDDAKILAGGQSLVPLLNFRLAAPSVVIDINQVTELAQGHADRETVTFGAMTRVRQFETDAHVAQSCTLLPQVAQFIAHPQIRSRGTFGGSLAHADPSAELPGAVVALDATMRLASNRGERLVGAGEFFEYHLTTVLEPDELLVEIQIPLPTGRRGTSFTEVAARHGDFAAAGVAAVIDVDDDGRVERARIVCISVGPTPVRVPEAEELLIGATEIDPALAADLQRCVAQTVKPSDQLRASVRYKRRVSGVLARDVVTEALARAQET